MRLYEDYGPHPDGWNISRTLRLEDDGRFTYGEVWTDYTNATLYGGAEGRWRQGDGAVLFRAERVEGPLTNAWVVGRELRAVERDGVIDFGGGFRIGTPPQRTEVFRVHNTGAEPLTIRLDEPTGRRLVLATGQRARAEAYGPDDGGRLEIVRREDEIVVRGWPGADMNLFYESYLAVTPAPPGAEPVHPSATTPPIKPTAPTPPSPPPPPPAVPTTPPPAPPRTDATDYPRFRPRTPSPELAARIRGWIEELPESATVGGLLHVCRENDSIPLNSNSIYLWTLRPDGQILCIDHESFSRRAEPETDPLTAYAALFQGARAYPEIRELLPPLPTGARPCERCGGTGQTPWPPPAKGADACSYCSGLGWY